MEAFHRLARVLLACLVVFAIGAAGNTLYAEWAADCTGQNEIGACPDFGSSAAEHAACDCACEELFSLPGLCNFEGCCECADPLEAER